MSMFILPFPFLRLRTMRKPQKLPGRTLTTLTFPMSNHAVPRRGIVIGLPAPRTGKNLDIPDIDNPPSEFVKILNPGSIQPQRFPTVPRATSFRAFRNAQTRRNTDNTLHTTSHKTKFLILSTFTTYAAL
jgi:hypothetical protein